MQPKAKRAYGITCLVCSLRKSRLCNWPDGEAASVECSEMAAQLEITNISPIGHIVCGSSFLLGAGPRGMPSRQVYSQIQSLDEKA